MLWTVDSGGAYRATWDIPWTIKRGRYRMVITAKRYRLVSRTFRVRGSRALTVHQVPARAGRVAVRLSYPQPIRDVDINYRPKLVSGGHVHFHVGRRVVVVKRKRSTVFSVKAPAGRRVSIGSGGAHDRFQNVARGRLLRR
jgi:hypothetical protein